MDIFDLVERTVDEDIVLAVNDTGGGFNNYSTVIALLLQIHRDLRRG